MNVLLVDVAKLFCAVTAPVTFKYSAHGTTQGKMREGKSQNSLNNTRYQVYVIYAYMYTHAI